MRYVLEGGRMMERWAVIEGYPDYSVSNLGRVMSRNCGRVGYILKQNLVSSGYLAVGLRRNGKQNTVMVHALVAAAFLSPRPAGYNVNHKDGIKANNTVFNLEWMTTAENLQHAIDLGLRDPRGEGNGRAKLTDDLVLALRYEVKTAPHGFYVEAARRLGVSVSTIQRAVTGKTWPHLPVAA